MLSQQYGTRIRILSRGEKDGITQEEVELWAKGRQSIDEALKHLASYPHIAGHELVSRSSDGSIARVVIGINGGGCPLSAAVGGFQTSAGESAVERIDYCGRIHWDLSLKGFKSLTKLRDTLERKFAIQDVEIKRSSGKKPMVKSMFLLKEAFERGYFDVPKKISIEELSAELGVPLSTLNVNIRRALRNALREHIN